MKLSRTRTPFFPLSVVILALPLWAAAQDSPQRVEYENRLTPIADPQPLLADYPQFVHPIHDRARFEAPPLVLDENADLSVRAWRFSYNARGIVEVPNRLRGDRTAVIVVHPWGIDDGQGWTTPEPAGVAFQCTPEKNKIARRHAAEVVNPLLKSWRERVALVMYSLPGSEDPIRKKLYRSLRDKPTDEDLLQGSMELAAKLKAFEYRGQPLPKKLSLSKELPLVDYFRQFPGLDAGAKYNNEGFWQLPIPVVKEIDVAPDDVVIYDAEGYEPLKKFLQEQGVRNILLTGYNTDMCVCSTTAGYKNLKQDFNVFLVGDATIATFPGNSRPDIATTAAVSKASLELFITQVSWIRHVSESSDAPSRTK